MSDDKEEGGIVIGGISFGTGSPKPKGKGAAAPVEVDSELMPLRMVLVADLAARGAHNAGANAPESAIKIDVGAFDELFERIKPRAAIEVESVLGDGKKVRVDFAPTSMKSFRPDQLVRDMPLLASLMDGRRVLERLRDGSIGIDGATTELNRLWEGSSFAARVLGGVELKQQPSAADVKAPAVSKSDGEGDVMRILDMVDTGTTASGDSDGDGAAAQPATAQPAAAPPPAAKKEGSKFGAFLAAVAHSGKDRPGARPDQGIALIEKALGMQLGAIVQHPEIRRLEEAWRGVHFLVSRAPKTGVKLEVLSVPPERTAELLSRAINAGAGIEPPMSVAIVDTVCDGDAAAFASLRALADIGEAQAVPIITNASGGLFGRHLEEVDRIDNIAGLYDAPERAPWRAESNRPAMLWLAMAMNRIYMRGAYDKRSSRIREATVAEQPDDEASAAVFIQPCWAIGSLIAKSFEKTGWPHRIVGAPQAGIVEDLAVREIETPGGETIAVGTEAFFSTESQKALGRLGVIALAAQPNNDQVYVMRANTAYVPPPKRTQDYDTAEDQVRYPQTPLVDQLFVARLAQFLHALGSKISAGGNAAEVEKVLQGAIDELFSMAPPPGPELDIRVSEADGSLTASVTVRPRRFLGVSMEEITLGVPLA